MSKIQEMIERLCPNGVVFKKILDIAEVGTGSSDRKDANPSGNFPFYVRSKDVLKSDKFLFDETAIVIPGEGGIGDIFHYVEGKYDLHQRAYRIHFIDDSICPKYAYYYFSNAFKSFIAKKFVEATVTSIRKPMIEGFEIPVPPIEVQREIVKVLDSFSEHSVALVAELDAELTARKKQFDYYRELLINGLDESVNRVPLSEVGTFTRGRRFVRNDIVEDGYPCIHYGDMYTYYGLTATKTRTFIKEELASKLRFAHKNDVVIVAAGENDEDIGVGVAWLGDSAPAVHDACYVFSHEQNPRYISHYLRTHSYHQQIKKYVSSAKISAISADGIGKAIIPLPSLEEQERIASILDKFEALTTSLSDSLPAEIKARQQQYEFYRDQLLTFKRAN